VARIDNIKKILVNNKIVFQQGIAKARRVMISGLFKIVKNKLGVINNVVARAVIIFT
jgi:hypothetical protein